jgi:hypothetical protein
MAATRMPAGLSTGGRALWKSITDLHVLDPVQEVQLLEACRAKDRLDQLDQLLRGDADTWCRLVGDDMGGLELVIDKALDRANTTANLFKQLLAALRLPDGVTGKKPQQRGGARGAYSAGGKTKPGTVSSLDRARAAKAGT